MNRREQVADEDGQYEDGEAKGGNKKGRAS
jgi:hypothetical protein